MQRPFTLLAHVVIPLAAFLTFMLQPVAGKLLMPIYGGSAGTWLTLSMFFQGALLGGYALAWRGLEKHRKALPGIVAGLAVLAPLSLRLPPWTFPALPEWPGVLAALTLSLLPTILLTTATGLILQGWIQQRKGSIPFYLYSISNVGSILALLAYPFVIEPHIGLGLQIFILKTLLWTLSAAVLMLCWLEKRVGVNTPVAADTEPEELPKGQVGAWLLLSFATCTLMLGAVPVLSAEYGSNPLTWLVPLGLYLLSFSLTFSGWWAPSFNYVATVVLGAALFGYMQTKGIGSSPLSGWSRLWLAIILFAGCLGGQGFLYRLRPVKNASFFYLIIAAGGLAAGLFVSAIAPFIITRAVEFTGAAFFLLTFLSLQLLCRTEAIARYSLVLLVLMPSAWFGYRQYSIERNSAAQTTYLRNTYGTLLLQRHADRLTLSNEATLHGEQVLDPKYRRLPTAYYTRGSAAGIVLNALRQQQPALRLGAIGLGTGTLAAYGRKDDHLVFWDINPLAIKLAREEFFFLRDCPAKVDIHQCDGRLGLAASPERFDVVLLDAFAGDAIPAHLITREAIASYLARLDQGILLVHISNRYLDLFPVVASGARFAGWNCLYVNSTPHPSAKLAQLATGTSYAVVYPPKRESEVMRWFDTVKNEQDFDFIVDSASNERVVTWTDDRSAIMDLLTWDHLLHH